MRSASNSSLTTVSNAAGNGLAADGDAGASENEGYAAPPEAATTTDTFALLQALQALPKVSQALLTRCPTFLHYKWS